MLNRDEVLCCYVAAYLEGFTPLGKDIAAASGLYASEVSTFGRILERRRLLCRAGGTARRIPTPAGLERARLLGVS